MSKILESVVDITSQKDADDLAYSVIATLAELIPLSSAAIIHLAHGNVALPLVRLEIKQVNKQPIYRWDQPSLELNVTSITQCVIEQQPICEQVADQRIYYFPVSMNELYSIVLQVNSLSELDTHYSVIQGLLLIYKNYHSLLEESEHDKLTGLLNRNSFERRISRLARDRRRVRPNEANNDSAWLAIVDIDFFKRINDNYGHVGGDEILLIIAQQMRKFFNNKNLLFRFGGEEFIIVLENMRKPRAQAIFEEFRVLIAQHNFPFDEHLTISIGYCELASFDYPTTIIDQADKALYHAKETGRNKVRNYHELVVQGLLSPEAVAGEIELFNTNCI